jgi:hypothetical protein
MIFHICPPDIKFIRSLIDRFEQIKPQFNRCIVIASKHHLNPRTDIDKSLIEYFGPYNQDIIKKINSSECQGIVIHTMNNDILELALNLPGSLPILWRSWGADLHDLLYHDSNLLLPHTQDLVYGGRLLRPAINFLRPLYRQLNVKDAEVRISKKIDFIKRIDYIATATRTEFSLLHNRIPGMKACYLPLNYRSLDFRKLPGMVSHFNPTRVMVGHSGYSYHNHADIFARLKDDYFPYQLMAPLNYGEMTYRKKLTVLGKRMFGEQIDFLTDFLAFEDYIKHIRNYDAFILNSKVQSGGGNIIYFLYQGSKVYLREENPVFIDFMEQGITIFSIQKEFSCSHLTGENISPEAKFKNRKILESLFGQVKERENVVNAYHAFSVTV